MACNSKATEMSRDRFETISVIIVVICLQLLSPGAGEGDCSKTGAKGHTLHERQLLDCLLHEEYDPAVRPATSPDTPVNVVVDSIIAAIIDLDEKTEILTTELWLMQTWTDPQLAWDPDSFGGLKEIRLPIEYIWTPSIVLLNNADDSFEYKMDKLARVNSSGVVVWTPHGRLRSYCNLDLSTFPFDSHRCVLQFGPWSYDKSLVSISLNPATRSHHRKYLEKSSEWTTNGYWSDVTERSVVLDGLLAPKQYQMIRFIFTIERTSIFFKYILIAPSVLLAALTLCLYWIPVQSGERFVLASGVFISVMLLVLLLERYLPSDIGRLPVVASYIGYNLFLALLTVIISIIVFNCHHRDDKTAAVPRFIRVIFLGRLSRLCCVNTMSYRPVSPDHGHSGSGSPVSHRRELFNLESDDMDRHNLSSGSSSATLEQTLSDIRNYLRVLAAAAGSKDDTGVRQGTGPSHRDLVIGEWQRVALVIDRVSFTLFTFISIIVTLALYAH